MPSRASTTKITAMAIKIKNNILAMPAAPAATPVKPKTPATSEMTAKMMAHFNIQNLLALGAFELSGEGSCAGWVNGGRRSRRGLTKAWASCSLCGFMALLELALHCLGPLA